MLLVSLEKPTITKTYSQLSEQKHITIYTNQIQSISQKHLREYIIFNEKLKIYDEMYTRSAISKDDVFFRVVSTKGKTNSNWVIDYLLGEGESLNNYESIIRYPIYFEILLIERSQRITSLTNNLSFRYFTMTRQLSSDFQKAIHSQDSLILGRGSFSTIHLVREKITSQPICLKLINKQHCLSVGEVSYIQNQYNFLTDPKIRYHSHFRHFVQLKYAMQDKEWVGFFMEWGIFGSLYSWIYKHQPITVSKNRLYPRKNTSEQSQIKQYEVRKKMANFYFIQVALAICKVHRAGYIYRDLKPENVIIDSRGNAKLCDFGYTKKIKEQQYFTELCGSYQYIPPEIIDRKSYNKSYDLYCLGLLFYEMLTQSNPFSGITPKNISQVKSIKIKYNSQFIDSDAEDLIKKLMEKNPQERLGHDDTAQIFKHRFFTENEELVVSALFNDKINPNTFLFEDFQICGLNPSEIDWQGIVEGQNRLKSLLGRKLINQQYNYLQSLIKAKQQIGPKFLLK